MQIHQNLVNGEIECVPSLCTIQRWVAQFESGDESLRHKLHTGRQVTSVTRANIDQVHQLIEEDPHSSIQIISTLLSIAYGSDPTILYDHLNMTNVCAQWIPHRLSDEQKRQRVTSAQESI